MNTQTVTTSTARVTDNPDLKPLLQFVAVAVSVGWVLLTIPLLLDLPVEPFVLGTLFLGLVLPTVVLTRRDPTASMRQLLRDTVRPPRPLWVLLPAALVIPGAVAGAAAVLGVGAPLTVSFVVNLAVMNVLSSLIVVNVWEEMASAGFVQRRAMARWGFAAGSTATALAFTGVHLPLSFYGADGVNDVVYNIGVMVVSGIGMRLVIGAFDGWGHRSILALGLIHATFNASSELLDPGAEWVRYAVTFLLGLGAWALHRMTITVTPEAAVVTVETAVRRDDHSSGPPAADDGGAVPMSTEVLRYAAFTDEGRGGNPAGVVLDAGALTDAQMLGIAAAVGYSETAFVVAGPDEVGGGPRGPVDHATVRFFSPVAEVAFCGHATVATAVALAERSGPSSLELATPAGPVAVITREETGTLVATLTSPPARTRPVDEAVLDAALAALGWRRSDVDPRYPAHVAFAGNDHLVLGVRRRDTLATLDYDYPALAALMAGQGWTTAHLFWPQTQTTFQVRDPFPPGGVVEDPATGAAAAAFGGYLRDLDLVPLPTRLTLHQGVDLGKPSLLLVDVRAGTRTVQVTGRATPLAPSPDDRDINCLTQDRSTT